MCTWYHAPVALNTIDAPHVQICQTLTPSPPLGHICLIYLENDCGLNAYVSPPLISCPFTLTPLQPDEQPKRKGKLLTIQLQLQITSASLWTAGMAVGGAGACLPLTVAARASQTQTLRSWRAIPRLFLSSLQQPAQPPAPHHR